MHGIDYRAPQPQRRNGCTRVEKRVPVTAIGGKIPVAPVCFTGRTVQLTVVYIHRRGIRGQRVGRRHTQRK